MSSSLVGDYIREKRKAASLTQVELAEKAGVGLRFVRDLEQGKRTLRMDTVNKVLALFGKCLGPVDMPRD
jgi:y4mF family transcriptional regulator